ncbi:multidrug effflux MFS transporter [Jannaschia formosa]|uniref:multidrug effflux MFS transporter n=1 Tax=Jannaschia formosa TaxID=2259592 RepID=UPI000E1B857D|nr:multidrug effflux MFS transporter [Jannaschia formosa]TFL16696.1 Bcr/CflA family efflux MFS transporter [Jannaschia formosa]
MTDIPASPARKPPHILTLVALVSLSTMAMNIFLPSLPSLAVWYETDAQTVARAVTLFLAVNATLQLVIGPLSDRFGRRPVILGGLAIFTVASVGCVFAPDVETFLAMRMVQASVVVAMALSRAVIRDLYEQDKAASMLGYVTMGMSVVPMIAPFFGGWLDGAFGWQASFWVMAIGGVAMFALTWVDLGETAPMRGGSFRAQVAEYPELLRSPRFWGYCLTSAFASGTFFAYLGGAPFVGSQVYGLSPVALGAFFGAPAVGYLVGNGLSGRFSQRFGVDAMILTGAVGQAAGLALLLVLTILGFDSPYVFFGLMSFLGLGNGLVLPNATAGMLSVRPHLAGTASGLGGAMMIGGGALLSELAGHLLALGGGALPLIALMVVSGFIAVGLVLLTIRRNRRVGQASG